MDQLICKEVEWDSELQRESVGLRYTVLREPLGLTFNEDDKKVDSESSHLLAVLNGEVVGCILVMHKDSDQKNLKMRQVAVSNKHQSMGIGSKLLKFSEDWARERNYQTMYCHARLTAVKFYTNNGYQTSGDEFLEVTIPHVFMSKSIVK